MPKTSYAVKLDPELLDDVKDFCDEKGYKQSSFVEKALREQMEREELKEDIFDLVQFKAQEGLAVPLKDYHRTRK